MFGCVNTDINNAVIVEIKSHLREEGIEQLLEQLEKFPIFYPEHANKKLFGMIACVSAAENVRNILRKKGIYLVIMGQEVARLQRSENFLPTNFNQIN
jgi:RecB family endonuclease NucS